MSNKKNISSEDKLLKSKKSSDIKQNNKETEKEAKRAHKLALKQSKKESKPKTDKKEKIKTGSKRTLVTFLIMSVLGASTGVFIGDWWNKNFGGAVTFDYNELLASNYSQTLKNNQGIDDYAYYSSYLSATPTSNTLQQCFLAAQYNSENADKYYFTSIGGINTIASQDIWAFKQYDKNNSDMVFYGENISTGIMNVAEATFFKTPDDITVALATKVAKQSDGSYLTEYNNPSTYKYNENIEGQKYSERYGSMPNIITPYIISKETVDRTKVAYNGEALGFSNFTTTTLNGASAWNFDINLHSVYSVLDYIFEVKAVSGLTEFPTFSEVKLNVTLIMLNGKLYIGQIKTDETYTMKYGALTPKVIAGLTQTFDYEREIIMPDVSNI